MCLHIHTHAHAHTLTHTQPAWKLGHLSVHKASGPDEIPNWVLRDFCDTLAGPIAAIANNTLRTSCVPPLWKRANVVAIPKVNPPVSIETDLRPISLTPVVSKVVEDFVYKWVLDIVKPQLHWDQYGALKGSSTVDALVIVYFLHQAYATTDTQGSHMRAILIDYQKAFDHLNHNLIIEKLSRLGVPRILVDWIASFLMDRYQCVKLGSVCSELLHIRGGVPQGTKLGPLLFLCMIDDLQMEQPCESMKFVDDTTIFERLPSRDSASIMQSALDNIESWTSQNNMNLNPTKTKELHFNFFKSYVNNSVFTIGESVVNSVKTAKLLGVTISADLKWNEHVDKIVAKASQRIYFLTILKRFGAPKHHLVNVYKTIIRPVLEYACQCWHPGLTIGLSQDIESVQKRAMRIIVPQAESYESVLSMCELLSLSARRRDLCAKYFDKIQADDHKLHKLLPVTRELHYDMRNSNLYPLPRIRTSRGKSSFITWALYNLQ